jgi:hypothetical protein
MVDSFTRDVWGVRRGDGAVAVKNDQLYVCVCVCVCVCAEGMAPSQWRSTLQAIKKEAAAEAKEKESRGAPGLRSRPAAGIGSGSKFPGTGGGGSSGGRWGGGFSDD